MMATTPRVGTQPVRLAHAVRLGTESLKGGDTTSHTLVSLMARRIYLATATVMGIAASLPAWGGLAWPLPFLQRLPEQPRDSLRPLPAFPGGGL